MRRSGWLLPLLLAGAVCGQQGQELLAAFDRLAARLDGAPREQLAELAAETSNAFLRLPEGAARDRRLPAGATATLSAGRVEHALRLSVQEPGAAFRPRLHTVRLRALAQLGRLVEFARLLRMPGQGARDAAAVALAQEEARLLPLAAAALRGPDRPAGRLVFERLYALEPFASYRASNLGLCLRQIGDLGAARRVYERGLERAPSDLELWNDYGLFLRAAGQREDALAAFRRGVELDLARGPAQRATGPAITNLLHLEALWPGSQGEDPVPVADQALAQRKSATMMRRLLLDVQLDRLTR